ncbi:acyl-CoA dehydrogenase family protein [Streptacidiphilus carbonis]|uniref:acyl-CoA dehydrogenase family protein n=1 Tax=Streptacidiphilus carbonis TaxID=105422 RepID=UPI0005A60A68|nr:acyl-CoA dehydrogenase family protein [Streptacidiphilus carbonis]
MDFTFTEEQQAAVEAARAAFADVAPDGVPSPAVNAEPVAEDIDRELWQRLAKSDLTGIALAEEYGGSGLDPVAWCLVLRESARVLARVPLLETGAAALAVQRYGSEAQRRQLLPEVAAGRLLLGVAPHGRTGHEPADQGVRAVAADPAAGGPRGGWVLDGVQTGVTGAQLLDRIVVPARCEQGSLLLLVDPHAPGVELRRQVTAHGELAAEMAFDGVAVDASAQLGEVDPDGANWLYLRGLLIVGTAALCLGLGEQILRITADYTGRREQFGHPIATFQAVSMQVADRYIDLRAMEVTLWQAAWRIGLVTAADGTDDPDRIPLAADLATAKVWSAEGVRSVAASAQHLHGGMGADLDYPLHRYHAWAKHLELYLGPAAAFEDEVATVLAAYQL